MDESKAGELSILTDIDKNKTASSGSSKKVIQNPFRSFWMGGFECTDQINVHGNRVDFLNLTSHLAHVNDDYRLLNTFNIKTVREGIRWSKVEYKPYHYDFSVVQSMIEAGKEEGVQQVWDICHFGYPDDISPLHPHFTKRFVALCEAFATFFKSVAPQETLIVTPVNEVSFICWLGGDVAATAPFCRHNGWEVKYGLMRAYIAGVAALKALDPTIRILTTEPLINVVPELNPTANQIEAAIRQHDLQYQAVDMLCGRICPELGGKPEYLDLLGFNYYYNNQWIAGTSRNLGWNDVVMDSRWRDLSDLLAEAHHRYDRPVVLTETSHPAEDRPVWIRNVAEEVGKAVFAGIPVWGICLYPIIDRPDWDNLDHWHHSGLWDHNPELDYANRVLHEPSAEALLESQRELAHVLEQGINQQSYVEGHPTLISPFELNALSFESFSE